MDEWLLLGAAVFAAMVALLTWRPAPPSMFLWKVALAAGEFGHWLAMFPLGIFLLATQAEEGLRGPILLVSGVACLGFLRPVLLASRLGRKLPRELEGAFGALAPGEPFQVSRLYWRRRAAGSVPQTATFAQRGELRLELDFYAAQNSASPAPCLVVVHGGGWDGGDRSQLADWNYRWAERGYAVAAVSYRLAPQWLWPAQREDVEAALQWLRREAPSLRIDDARLVLVGRSAGGQIATAVAYAANDPAIVGAISFYAPQDMPFAWTVSREDDALNSAKLMRQYLGGPPDSPERRARYESASAQLLVHPRTPPTLLLHGEPDTLVWHRHSVRLAARLREAGVRHHFLSLPWATHGFDFNPDGPGGQLADYAIESFLRAVTRMERR